MKVAFTICSNNYLAQAITLGESLITLNPDYTFIIGLVDNYSTLISYKEEIPFNILSVEELNIPNFNEIWGKYNIIELNTCVKPIFFQYLFKKFSDIDYLIYFDPDICLFNSISEIESKFADSDFILTPHITNPLPLSEERPNEYDFLNYGIYNIGFLGLKRSEQVLRKFLPWWEERTLKLGFIKPCEGLFVDQIWFNLVPLLYTNIHILTHNGCNMAPWNLHERKLTSVKDSYLVNEDSKLIFFHFSSFRYKEPSVLFYNYGRNDKEIDADLRILYNDYYERLIRNNIQKYSEIKCHYSELRQKLLDCTAQKKRTFKKKIKRTIKNFLPFLMVKILSKPE